MSGIKKGGFALATGLLVLLSMTTHAQAQAAKQQTKGDARSLYEDNELAQSVIEAYRKIETYRAVWSEDPIYAQEFMGKAEVEGKPEFQFTVRFQIAFERDGHKALVRSETASSEENSAARSVSLTIYDGDTLHIGIIGGPDRKVLQRHRKKTPQLSYPRFRRMEALILPFDMPFLWSEAPIQEMLRGKPKSLKTMPPAEDDEQERPRLAIRYEQKNTPNMEIILTVDPETHLIEETLINGGKPQQPLARYEIVEVAVDKELEEGTFSFDAQVKAFQAEQ